MNREQAEARLTEYLIHGLLLELSQAEEAYALAAEIGRRAEQVNAAGFGQLFAVLQQALSDRQTLSVAKLFEEQKRARFRVRSIPTVLQLLDEGAAVWVVREPTALAAVLGSATDGASGDREAVAACTAQLTRHYRGQLDSPRLAEPLRRLRDSRDKVIAHNESVDPTLRERPTWGDAAVLGRVRKVSTRRLPGVSAACGAELQLARRPRRTRAGSSRR